MKERKFLRRSLGSIATLTLWAVLLSALLLSAVNDVYAFVKPEGTVTVTLDAPLSDRALARRLEEAGVIQSPTLFALYLGVEEHLPYLGQVTLERDMSYRELRTALQAASEGKN